MVKHPRTDTDISINIIDISTAHRRIFSFLSYQTESDENPTERDAIIINNPECSIDKQTSFELPSHKGDEHSFVIEHSAEQSEVRLNSELSSSVFIVSVES